MRRGRVAIIARQRPSVRRTLLRACREAGSRCRWIDPLQGTALALPGAHQRQNAALAVATATELGVRASAQALQRLRWPGRIETVAGRPPIVLDGAHDPVSARALADELRSRGEGAIHLVIGMYRDKEAARILRALLPLAERVFVTRPRGARALPATDLARICRKLTHAAIDVHQDAGHALEAARVNARDRTICVTGSLALVGEARDLLGLVPADRLWDGLLCSAPSGAVPTIAP